MMNPPPALSSTSTERLAFRRMAYHRFLARALDLAWEHGLLLLLARAVAGPLIEYSLWWFIGWTLYATPGALILDAGIHALWKTTPGRWWIGLEVRTLKGEPIGAWEYLRRNLLVWIVGLGFFLPLIQQCLCWREFNRLLKGEPTSYDARNGWQMVHHPVGPRREHAFILCNVAIFLAIVAAELFWLFSLYNR